MMRAPGSSQENLAGPEVLNEDLLYGFESSGVVALALQESLLLATLLLCPLSYGHFATLFDPVWNPVVLIRGVNPIIHSGVDGCWEGQHRHRV